MSQILPVQAEHGCQLPAVRKGPLPAGVSIDAQQNIAAVTLAGCNKVAPYQSCNRYRPNGRQKWVTILLACAAVIPRLHVAVVANNMARNNASIVG